MTTTMGSTVAGQIPPYVDSWREATSIAEDEHPAAPVAVAAIASKLDIRTITEDNLALLLGTVGTPLGQVLARHQPLMDILQAEMAIAAEDPVATMYAALAAVLWPESPSDAMALGDCMSGTWPKEAIAKERSAYLYRRDGIDFQLLELSRREDKSLEVRFATIRDGQATVVLALASTEDGYEFRGEEPDSMVRMEQLEAVYRFGVELVLYLQ